jgi:hypothetical protein
MHLKRDVAGERRSLSRKALVAGSVGPSDCRSWSDVAPVRTAAAAPPREDRWTAVRARARTGPRSPTRRRARGRARRGRCAQERMARERRATALCGARHPSVSGWDARLVHSVGPTGAMSHVDTVCVSALWQTTPRNAAAGRCPGTAPVHPRAASRRQGGRRERGQTHCSSRR